MKIPIRVEHFAGGLRPMVICSLRSEEPHIFGFLNAIIDTGSPSTILGGADIQRMRISQIQMRKFIGEEREVNLGGAQMKTRVLQEGEIRIGDNISVKLPIQVPVRILKGTPPPTILGVDFLIKAKAKFVFYPSEKESDLEIFDI